MLCYICVIYVFCLVVVIVKLSVPVQVIDCMERLVSEMVYNVLNVKPYTHSLTHSYHFRDKRPFQSKIAKFSNRVFCAPLELSTCAWGQKN